MKKTNPAKRLMKTINAIMSFSKHLDAFTKGNPFLLEDEAFVKASLAVKETILNMKLPLDSIYDVVAKFYEDETDDD